MCRLTSILVLMMLSLAAPLIYPLTAAGDSGGEVRGAAGRWLAKAWGEGKTPDYQSRRPANSANHDYSRNPEDKAQAAQVALIKKQAATIQTAFLNYSACVNSMQPVIDHGMAPFCKLSFPAAAKAAGVKPEAGVAGAVAAALDPVDVAYIALARLALTPPTPGIGPPPSINEWKMAAVGYPLWLWVAGDTAPPRASDSVAGLSVSLHAHVSKIVFSMGDGHNVSCANTGTPWTPAVAAGAKSPTCGYTYQRPSLPEGSYTVTAQTHWSIDWTVNGESGTIPFVQSTGTTLPVGELQVLVR
jgi:hypothetical protein